MTVELHYTLRSKLMPVICIVNYIGLAGLFSECMSNYPRCGKCWLLYNIRAVSLVTFLHILDIHLLHLNAILWWKGVKDNKTMVVWIDLIFNENQIINENKPSIYLSIYHLMHYKSISIDVVLTWYTFNTLLTLHTNSDWKQFSCSPIYIRLLRNIRELQTVSQSWQWHNGANPRCIT